MLRAERSTPVEPCPWRARHRERQDATRPPPSGAASPGGIVVGLTLALALVHSWLAYATASSEPFIAATCGTYSVAALFFLSRVALR